MSRLSFDKKRAQQPAVRPAVVHVRVSDAGVASVDGTAVAAAAGEDVQQAVLDHLQRLAISLGGPIRATVQDDRAGCVVPLEVAADGSSRVVGEPVRTAVASAPDTPRTRPDAPARTAHPAPVHERACAPAPAPRGAPRPAAAPAPAPMPVLAPSPVSAPTPPRGFDAVAEQVLADDPVTETVEGAATVTGPLARINEAVRAGRLQAAGELADRTVAEASGVLGHHHPEVLHVRELAAYVAYLAGDPVGSFRLSLELAGLRRRARNAEAAYGNVRSAATAWRAVRDPQEGLRLGRDLIGLWSDLAAEPGPAADDPEPLEAARARMVRLADRAAKAARA